jgi:Flp pilus assembly protein TadD
MIGSMFRAARAPESSPKSSPRSSWTALLFLGLVTALAFWPTFENGFVEWDDTLNLVDNPHYRGLGPSQLKWMLTTYLGGHYIPVTWLSFGLDYLVWGLRPLGYHFTGLAIHIGAALVFWSVAKYLLARATALSGLALEVGATTAALVFAVHPLRVESVAWATERRDVLSGLLALLTVRLYLRAAEATGTRRSRLLAGVLVTYLLALASKSIVFALPLVLLVLDVYPLGRLRDGPRGWLGPGGRAVLWEKVPWMALSLGAGVVAYRAQLFGGGIKLGTAWFERIANVGYSLCFYLGKTIWPGGLSPLYEAPESIDPGAPRFLLAVAGALGITLLVWMLRRRWPAGLAAWMIYVVLLAPVSGAFTLGQQLVADRYSYLACLPWALLVGAGVGVVVRARSEGRLARPLWVAAMGTAVVALVMLATLTSRQVRVWHDSERLWAHAVGVEPDCVTCRINVGHALLDRGEALEALVHFHHAVTVRPTRSPLYRSVGLALASLGRYPEAVAWYERGLELRPQAMDTRASLAAALTQMGRRQEAVDRLAEGLRYVSPAGMVQYFRSASEWRPTAPIPRLGLIEAYLRLGDREQARQEYQALSRLDPELALVTREALGL